MIIPLEIDPKPNLKPWTAEQLYEWKREPGSRWTKLTVNKDKVLAGDTKLWLYINHEVMPYMINADKDSIMVALDDRHATPIPFRVLSEVPEIPFGMHVYCKTSDEVWIFWKDKSEIEQDKRIMRIA